jgi:hypothetical protein
VSDAVTALRAITLTPCREWPPNKANICGAQAEFVLWGKLFPAEALGPRCYDCAATHVDRYGLMPNSGYALIDLRPALAALSAEGVS